METKFEGAKQIVQEAADYFGSHERRFAGWVQSSPTDLVTRLRLREVQELLVDRIKSSYLRTWFAEEGCLRAAVDQGSVWVIDPLTRYQ